MGTLNNFASVLDYPLSAIKNSARPAYWVPDEECLDCTVCRKNFETSSSSAGATTTGLASSTSSTSSGSGQTPSKLRLHHCRQCGKGVCGECSRGRKLVPLRGWDIHPVRVCDICIDQDLQLSAAH